MTTHSPRWLVDVDELVLEDSTVDDVESVALAIEHQLTALLAGGEARLTTANRFVPAVQVEASDVLSSPTEHASTVGERVGNAVHGELRGGSQ